MQKFLLNNFYSKKYKRKKTNNPFDFEFKELKRKRTPSKNYDLLSGDFLLSEGKEVVALKKTFNFAKLYFLFFLIIVFVFLLLAKSAWLQIKEGDYYYKMAEGNRIRIKRIDAKRGIIYDRYGRAMVRNKADFLLYLIPADLPKEDEKKTLILKKIGEILGDKVLNDTKNALKKIDFTSMDSYQPLFISDHIAYDQAMKLYLYVDDWPGVVLSNKFRREYLNYVRKDNTELEPVLSLSHILGYVGKINSKELEKFGKEYSPIDYIGKMGIEYFWENELRGQNGKKQIEVDALGKEKKVLNEVEARDGHNLLLSLDLDMQKELEEILKKHLKEIKRGRASAIVMNPNNGEILAMVSLPAYDNNLFARGIKQSDYQKLINEKDKPLFNRSISGEFPSGSTFKPIMAVAALEEHIVSENTTFLSVGGIRIGQWFFPDWLDGGHGRVNIRKAIAWSVNTYFYYIGGGYKDFQGLGVDRIVKYAKLFGLGSQTGIDLAGEADGFVPSREWKEKVKKERWYIGDTYHLSIGQGDLLVTPLQVVNYISVFANGGSLYRPHLVQKILSDNDKVIKEISVKPVREKFLNPYNVEVIKKGMRDTVLYGSARRLNTLPISSAGKTGTAQWSSKKDPHAWYVGFAPYEKPKISFAILIEEGGEGSSVCVPVAYDFLNWYYEKYEKDK